MFFSDSTIEYSEVNIDNAIQLIPEKQNNTQFNAVIIWVCFRCNSHGAKSEMKNKSDTNPKTADNPKLIKLPINIAYEKTDKKFVENFLILVFI